MPNTGEPQGQEPEATDPNPTTPPASTEKADPWEGLPEEWAWTKTALESANREAASRRVALRETEDKLKAAKTPEEFQAAMNDYTEKESRLTTDLERERAARRHGLTDEVLEFLTAKTPDEIEKQAAKLAALKPGAPKVITQAPPSGGVTPTQGTPKEESGRAAWRAYKERR